MHAPNGGRTAEELARGEVTSGAQNDLQEITRIARTMVTQLGMADELGPEYFHGPEGALDGQAYVQWEPKDYSEETARRIDEAVSRLISDAHARARDVLTTHRAALEAVAMALLRDESLDRDQLTEIIGPIQTPAASEAKATSGPGKHA